MAQFELKEGEALVFFVRPALMAKLIKFKVFANGTPIGWTRGRKYIYKSFEPGIYEFISKAENKAKIKIDVKAGKIYYIKQEIELGFLKSANALKLLTQEEGKIALSKCKPSKSMKETDLF
jgi:hypothetical protein